MVVALTVVGCGTQRTEWPAYVTSLDGFSEEELQEVRMSIDKLNAESDRPLVILDGEPAQTSYLIHIERSNPWPNEPLTAGITMRDDDLCSVALSTELFKSERANYVDSVVWHELGHCAGLTHNPTEGSMMFATAKPFTFFSSDALRSFIQDVEKSLSSEGLGH